MRWSDFGRIFAPNFCLKSCVHLKKKKKNPAIFAAGLNFCVNGKNKLILNRTEYSHISKIIIVFIIGTLSFCRAKTVLSLAKQYSSYLLCPRF